MRALSRLLTAWRDFFFTPVSPVNIAVYRILLGSIAVVDGLLCWPERFIWFGEDGVLPLADSYLVLSDGRLNLFEWFGSGDSVVDTVVGAYILSAALMTAGACTRLATVSTFITLVSLHHRNGLILNSGDTLMRVMLFYMMFAPAGQALSVDRWLRVRRGRESSDPPGPHAPWAQRIIQMQLCLLYLSTALLKSRGETWLDGTAVYYSSRVLEFQRLPFPVIPDYLWTVRLATYFTLFVEYAWGFLVWSDRWRYPTLLAGIALHVGIDWSMNIPLFAWIALSPYVLFVTPEDLERWLAAARRRMWPRARARESTAPLG